MPDDRDLRNVILILVRACKLYEARALSAHTALSRIAELHPTKRALLTHEEIGGLVTHGQPMAEELANQEAAQIEKALSSESDPFLEALRIYASRHFW